MYSQYQSNCSPELSLPITNCLLPSVSECGIEAFSTYKSEMELTMSMESNYRVCVIVKWGPESLWEFRENIQEQNLFPM